MNVTITYYLDNEPRTTTVLNRPLAQLAAAVEGLAAISGGNGVAGALVAEGLPCGPLVAVGDIVSLEDGVAQKALAVWGSPGPEGRVCPSYLARPIGVVTEVVGAVATVLLKGMCSNSAVMSALEEVDGDGDYYLSSSTPGTLTTDLPYLPVKVLSVSGGNVIVDISLPPYELHIHVSFQIETDVGSWVSSISGDYAYVYEGSELSSLLTIPAIGAIITVDGVIDETNYLFDISSGELKLRAKVVPKTGDFLRVYTTVPYTRDLPVVRAITTAGSGRLRADDVNGVVTITLDGPVPEGTAPINAPTAIHNYQPNGAPIITRVVSLVTAGPNISATTDSDGVCTVSAGYTSKSPIYPSFIDLDGVSAVSTGGELYFYFPATGTPSVIGVIPVISPVVGQRYRAYPFAIATSKIAAFSGVGLTASVRFVPSPQVVTFGTPATVAIQPTAQELSVADVGVSSGYVSMITSASYVTLTEGGQVHLRLSKTSGSTAYLSGFGLIIVPEDVE